MRKYLEAFRLSFKTQLVWRFDVAAAMLATVARILAAYIVWRAVFGSRALVGGFTFEAMLSYYIVGALLSALDFSRQLSAGVSELIRAGRFSGYMVMPMNPFGLCASMAAGESAFRLGFSLLAAVLCALLFGVGITLAHDLALLALGAVMGLVGLLFMDAYQYFIGILAFRFLDINFFLYVQDAVIAFAVGSMVPLSLLPGQVLYILRFLPFTHVVYTPAMLLTGQLGWREGLFGLFVLSAWMLAMLVIGQRTYSRLRKKYDGVGI
jgi:ABC-2 type transport system permease protein